MKGKLFVVATPIGNLDDITARAVLVLSEADIIAAEDTRTSSVLLNRYDIKTKLISNHKFNELGKVDYFINEILLGKNIAVISDAGTPCVSDPGYILVREAAKHDIEIIGVCGACAAVTALSVSGFSANNFTFVGFLPREKKDIENTLNVLNYPSKPVVIFYESPKRVSSTIRFIQEKFPDTKICLCNDLTKKFEKIYRGSPAEVLEELQCNSNAEKGEYTCVIENQCEYQEKIDTEAASIESQLVDIMIKSNCSLKSAVKTLSADSKKSVSKKEIYAASLRLKELLTTQQYQTGARNS